MLSAAVVRSISKCPVMLLYLTIFLVAQERYLVFADIASPSQNFDRDTTAHDQSLKYEKERFNVDGSQRSGLDAQNSSSSVSFLDGLTQEQLEATAKTAEAHAFQTEQDRLMKLIVNSLYKNKEIFMRELISNGCDAIDKIRHQSLTDFTVLQSNNKMAIWIKANKETNMIHITDSGVGMTEKHLRDYLGTIARSQTSEFLKTMEGGKVPGPSQDQSALNDVIGQFGVGFYSAFLVADKVVVTSKHNNDSQFIWESDSKQFRVMKDPRGDTLKRGTTVSLHLKEEASEYLDIYKLRKIIMKYSQFVNYPIYLWNHKEVEREEPIEDDAADQDEESATSKKDEKTEAQTEDEKEKKEGEDATADDVKVSDEDDEKKEKSTAKKTRKIKDTMWFWDHVNNVKPLWQRKPHEITREEYVEFYKALTKRNEEPLTYVHFAAEGDVNFRAIVFIPKTTTPMYATSLNREKLENIKLYVRRVFITDQTDLSPSYLNFIIGIVDSDDLSLNISREELQQSSILRTIRKKLVRKILDTLKSLNSTQYEEIWKEFGTNLKFGINEDSLNRIRLAKLLRFYSSHSTREGKQNFTSLDDYVSRAKEDQKSIYYVSADTLDKAKSSPFVERLTMQGYEVLYLVDAMDQICVQHLPDFQKMKFQNVAKEGLDVKVSDKDKKRREKLEKTFEPLSRWLEDSFSDKVTKVLISDRLVETPMVFVAAHWGYDGNMERISRAQAYQKVGGDSATVHFANMKRKLEINPKNPLIKEMLNRVQRDKSDRDLREFAEICVDTALIRSGYELRDPVKFTGRIETMLREAMHIPERSSSEDFDSDDNDDEMDDVPTKTDPDDFTEPSVGGESKTTTMNTEDETIHGSSMDTNSKQDDEQASKRSAYHDDGEL